MAGVEGTRVGRRNWNLEVTVEGKAARVFLVCWDGDE